MNTQGPAPQSKVTLTDLLAGSADYLGEAANDSHRSAAVAPSPPTSAETLCCEDTWPPRAGDRILSRPESRCGLTAHTSAMPDEPLYDPDRMVPEDLDFSDLDVVKAYLYHPTTQALSEDSGRQFRVLPAAQQRATLDDALAARRADRQQLAARIESLGPDDPHREALLPLLKGLDTIVEMMTLRLHELDEAR